MKVFATQIVLRMCSAELSTALVWQTLLCVHSDLFSQHPPHFLLPYPSLAKVSQYHTPVTTPKISVVKKSLLFNLKICDTETKVVRGRGVCVEETRYEFEFYFVFLIVVV